MAEKMKPDKLMLDVRQADAAGLSYGRWRFEETERIRKGKEIIRRQCEERRRRRDIEKAVSWWAGKLMDHQPHSNGDDSFTSVAVCFLADTMRQSVTLDQLNTFKAALAKSIEEYAKSIQAFGFSIGSDYGPCKMLADAAAEAGIDRANFPFKTTMFFTEKEGVLVRDGYGAPAVRIC